MLKALDVPSFAIHINWVSSSSSASKPRAGELNPEKTRKPHQDGPGACVWLMSHKKLLCSKHLHLTLNLKSSSCVTTQTHASGRNRSRSNGLFSFIVNCLYHNGYKTRTSIPISDEQLQALPPGFRVMMEWALAEIRMLRERMVELEEHLPRVLETPRSSPLRMNRDRSHLRG